MDFYKNNLLYAFLIVCTIYIIYNYIILNNHRNHINGLYRATNEFLELADVDNILLYIDNNKGYIVIHKNDEIIFNDAITYSDSLFNITNLLTYKNMDKISFKMKIPEIKNEWQTDKNYYDVNFSSINNTMEIYSNDTIFAILQREPEFETTEESNVVNEDSEKIN